MQIDTCVITGATGYMSKVLIPFLMETYHPKSLRLLGRSEWKLAQLLRKYNDLYTMRLLRPMICDVRDRERVFSCLEGADLVIHTAALKRLEICNYNPQEAIKTNVIGSMNVMDACLSLKPDKVIFASSDKAVNATNLYGKTKAVMESMVVQRAESISQGSPTMCCTRWGNVVGSTGAVIPYFIERAKQNLPLTITDERMTRFIVSKKMIRETTRKAIEEGKMGEIVIPENLKSISILDAAKIIKEYLKSDSVIKVIGTYADEKLHEEIEIGKTSEHTQITESEFIEILEEDDLW